jgi:hypothetical protein
MSTASINVCASLSLREERGGAKVGLISDPAGLDAATGRSPCRRVIEEQQGGCRP